MKLQVLPRLFTKPVDVKSFMKSNITVQEKQRRMKKEVKYDRMSRTTMKESHALFRLKKIMLTLMQKSMLITSSLI